MMNNLTELVFILDCSHSMRGLESETIGKFNSIICNLKHATGQTYVTTFLANNRCTMLHRRENIRRVKPLMYQDYHCHHSSALIDAIGSAVQYIDSIHSQLSWQDRPHKTQFIIISDGLDTSSYRFSRQQVKYMIREQNMRNGWQFLFAGPHCNIPVICKRQPVMFDAAYVNQTYMPCLVECL